ncbi:MAG: hypothetical protein M1490_03865 [Candidatus Bathyarchaeota archaeon]|nr:hypothetical protein [Candidatus Bathyarchaeota archaeon]
MPRKAVVKVVLSKEQVYFLDLTSKIYGMSQSEVLRTALMEYMKELGLLQIKQPCHLTQQS